VLTKAEAQNTKGTRMIHGSGSINGESTGKLTGELANIEFIRKHKSDFGAEAPTEAGDARADHKAD
jgi:hypothetical protein